MDTIIIGQGYNIKEETSVGKELIKQFESKRYDSFTCLVAFASYGGVSALTEYIKEGKEKGMKIKVILGIDQKATSKEALEEVLSWDVDSRIYHTSSNNIFHPKVYLFENRDIFTLIVGSNNLTVPGLVHNIECSLLIKDTISPSSVHDDFYRYWKGILEGTETHLYTLTQELIDELFAYKYIPSESERAQRYDNGADTEKTTREGTSLFKKAAIQPLPEGFRPQRHVKVKKNKQGGAKKKPQKVEESLYVGEEVLIAEIGGGPRWKQVNFPVNIFEDFFGAERGNNAYSIKLMNIAKDGSLGEVEIRQAVSVKSRNYRFEINCAETEGAYPADDMRPIGLFIKLYNDEFLYQVLKHGDKGYNKIKEYLYQETKNKARELKRAVVHVEAIHAIYPELII
jgi:HKD family nuclease